MKQQQQSELCNRIQVFEMENASLKQQLTAYSAKIAELTQRVATFDALTADLELMTERAEDAETACAQRENEIDELNDSLESATSRAETAERLSEELKVKLRDTEKERVALLAVRDQLEAQRKLAEERAKSAEERNGELKSELSETVARLQASSELLNSAETKRDKVAAQLTEVQRALDEAVKECDAHAKDMTTLKLALAGAERDRTELQEKVGASEREALRSREENAEQRALLRRREEQLKQSEAKADAALSELAILKRASATSVPVSPPSVKSPSTLPPTTSLEPLSSDMDPLTLKIPGATFQSEISRNEHVIVWKGTYNAAPAVFKTPVLKSAWQNELSVLQYVFFFFFGA